MPYIRGIKDFSQSDEIINEQDVSNAIEVVWTVEGIGQFKDYYITNQDIEEFLRTNPKLQETTFENFFHRVLYGDLSDPLPGYTQETKQRKAVPVSAQTCKVTMAKQGARILSRENNLHTINTNKEELEQETGKLKKIVVHLGQPGYAAIVTYDTGNGLQNAWNLDKQAAEEASYLFRKASTQQTYSGEENIICALSHAKDDEDRSMVGHYTELAQAHDYCFAAANFEGIKPLISRLTLGANNSDIMCPVFAICNDKEFFLNAAEIAQSKGIEPKTSDHETYIQFLEEMELMATSEKKHGR